MNQPNNAPPQDGNAPGRKPDYIAYNVTGGKEGKGYFNKVGAAWQHKDGQGYDLQLESMPVNGRITLREMREERIQQYDDQRQSQGLEQGQQQTQDVNHNYERSR